MSLKITINGAPLEIFRGATVEDVLRKFSKKIYGEVLQGKFDVYDQREFKYGLKGELTGGEKIVIKEVL